MKRLIALALAITMLSGLVTAGTLTASAETDVDFSQEYKSSPFYTRLIAALESSEGKTTMEKAAAAAVSQEGYKNYSTEGIDIEQARLQGLLWTGAELRNNDNGTGNTEYTRWAQTYIMNSTGSGQYLDCDWCAIFASWCMFRAGYCNEERLRRYYYSYCADPRIEYDADAWIEAFDLDQKDVWYTPAAQGKLDAYSWNNYVNTQIDPFDIPYKPGGLVFFTWNGSGRYFNHVAVVIDYDADTHVLTFSNGNSDGQVVTRQMDLDVTEEYRGNVMLQNSLRIMAYGEYDEIKPLDRKDITADVSEITWDRTAPSGIIIQTDSESKIASVSVDGEYFGSNTESNMVLLNGRLSIGKSEMKKLSIGEHSLLLTFDDGAIELPLTIMETIVLGDADGNAKVTIEDATLVQKYAARAASIEDDRKERSDVNHDGKIDITDSTLIQMHVANMITLV